MRGKSSASSFLRSGSPGQILRRCLVETSYRPAGVKRILRIVADLPQKHAEWPFKVYGMKTFKLLDGATRLRIWA